jgi:hypothetical protein
MRTRRGRLEITLPADYNNFIPLFDFLYRTEASAIIFEIVRNGLCILWQKGGRGLKNIRPLCPSRPQSPLT